MRFLFSLSFPETQSLLRDKKRYFKKTDSTGSKESLKKESIGSYDPEGGSDGKVRVDKTYRDPGTAAGRAKPTYT